MDAEPLSSYRLVSVPDRALQRILVVLVALALVSGVVPLFAVALVFRFFPSPRLVLLLLGMLGVLSLAPALLWRANPFAEAGSPGADAVTRDRRLHALALWAACGAAGALALAAVAVTAQAISLRYIIQAQANTLPYLLLQPVAAAVFCGVAALAGDIRVLTAVLGRATPLRRVAVGAALLAVSALAATAFLAGDAGPWLPSPVWFLGKTVMVAAGLVVLRRALDPVAEGRRIALAWAAVPLALANLAATLIVLAWQAAE